MRKLTVALAAAAACAAVQAAEFSGSAFVRDDGSLRISNRTVRLWGIYVPETRENCITYQRPVVCAPEAALALRRKIRGFVRCTEMRRNDDGTVSALCRANYGRFDDGDDLGAYLINRGWAVATHEAPFEYHIGERIARANGLGIWGLPLVVEP